jgi:hypothetical protein
MENDTSGAMGMNSWSLARTTTAAMLVGVTLTAFW